MKVLLLNIVYFFVWLFGDGNYLQPDAKTLLCKGFTITAFDNTGWGNRPKSIILQRGMMDKQEWSW